MKQYYAREGTANPIWLAQRKARMGQWETLSVFHSRELAEDWLKRKSHHYGTLGKDCRCYCVPIYDDEKLVIKMSELVESD